MLYVYFLNIIDINECNLNDACTNVGNSTCVNNPGSYECVCGNGFVREGNNCKGKSSSQFVYKLINNGIK